MAYYGEIPIAGLTNRWQFDNNLNDSIGSANLSFNGSSHSYPTGKFGTNCLATSTPGSYTCAYYSGNLGTNNVGSFMFSLWINWNGTVDNEYDFLQRNTSTSGSGTLFRMSLQNITSTYADISVSLNHSSSWNVYTWVLPTGQKLTINNWHHVVGLFNGSYTQAYFNGLFSGNLGVGGGTWSAITNGKFVVGSGCNGNGSMNNSEVYGSYDDVIFINSGYWSQTEVMNYYNLTRGQYVPRFSI